MCMSVISVKIKNSDLRGTDRHVAGPMRFHAKKLTLCQISLASAQLNTDLSKSWIGWTISLPLVSHRTPSYTSVISAQSVGGRFYVATLLPDFRSVKTLFVCVSWKGVLDTRTARSALFKIAPGKKLYLARRLLYYLKSDFVCFAKAASGNRKVCLPFVLQECLHWRCTLECTVSVFGLATETLCQQQLPTQHCQLWLVSTQ